METSVFHNDAIKLVECPRDSMQGWPHIISTETKINYLNALLAVGFDTLDFGSFVSAKAIPQMADTKDLVDKLDLSNTETKLLAIVANARGAKEAADFPQISYLGFPFSISETFQKRNTNSSREDSLNTVDQILDICKKNGKELLVYISMGFGNPYGDLYSQTIALDWISRIVEKDIHIISMADTVGLARPEQVYSMMHYLIESIPGKEWGVHLHSRPDHWKAKVQAALQAGCRRFDGALKGIGGCPMAGDDLVGNMDTEQLIPYFKQLGLLKALNEDALNASLDLASGIF
jgi:hydroxymethylglutaryl-CoA lyase